MRTKVVYFLSLMTDIQAFVSISVICKEALLLVWLWVCPMKAVTSSTHPVCGVFVRCLTADRNNPTGSLLEGHRARWRKSVASTAV